MHPTLRRLVPALAAFALAAGTLPCSAQVAPDTTRRYQTFVSLGTSQAQRLPDGFGVHAGAGLVYALGRRVGVRLEGTYHAYGEVPVYPCLFQDADRCYSTVDRQVLAGLASLVYDIPIAGETLYLIGGTGLYRSRRVATQHPACAPNQGCSSTVYRLSIQATQPGISGGIGMRRTLGKLPLSLDARIHFVERTTPEGGRSNDYFLMPLTFTVGL